MLKKAAARILRRSSRSRTGPALDISVWEHVRDRLVPEAWPEFTPSFRIAATDTIFTIGSCFARHIEDLLAERGFDVPMKSFSVPREEAPHLRRPNGILNKFSPPAVVQEIEWAARIRRNGGRVAAADVDPLLFAGSDGRVVDLHIGGYLPVTRERALERRRQIYDVVSRVFSSRVVIVTLGLVEAWLDERTGLFIQRAPRPEMLADGGEGRFRFVRLDCAACLGCVRRAIAEVRRENPGCKFLLTVSPIPLRRTFTGEDILTANAYSKAVLRAVCGEVARASEGVDYFPAYESVTLTRGRTVLEPDLRQVAPGFVEKIVARMAERYVISRGR